MKRIPQDLRTSRKTKQTLDTLGAGQFYPFLAKVKKIQAVLFNIQLYRFNPLKLIFTFVT